MIGGINPGIIGMMAINNTNMMLNRRRGGGGMGSVPNLPEDKKKNKALKTIKRLIGLVLVAMWAIASSVFTFGGIALFIHGCIWLNPNLVIGPILTMWGLALSWLFIEYVLEEK